MDCKGLKGEELKKCQEKKKKNLTNTLKTVKSNSDIRKDKREEQAALRKDKREVRRLKRIDYTTKAKNTLGLKTLGTVTKITRLK